METRVRYRSIIDDNSRWEGFALRDGDIIISTPPKCGTTWTQMICALLIFGSPDLTAPVDQISPWLDQLLRPLDAVVSDLNAQTHRRFIKSHTPLDGLPFRPGVTYITAARDPRDVALSWDNHMANIDIDVLLSLRRDAVGLEDLAELGGGPTDPTASAEDRFWSWMEMDSHMGLGGLIHHLDTFHKRRDDPNVILLHYADLKDDLEGQMRKLAAQLSIEVPETKWPALVKAATFEEMKRRAPETGPNQTECVWRDREQFFHRGRLGEWRGLMNEAALQRYAARVQGLASPELSDWIHRGPVGPLKT